MTNLELENRLRVLVSQERRITAEVIELIREAEFRGIFRERGFPNSFEWLVRGMGYSHSAAFRRIQAARIVKAVPEVSKKLQSGELKLTSVATLQNAIAKEERRTQLEISTTDKVSLLKSIEGKSEDAARAIIGEKFPESCSPQNSLRSVNEKSSRLNILVSEATRKSLERAKEVLSHKLPHGSWDKVLQCVLTEFLRTKDPLQASTRRAAAPAARREITKSLRRKILQRARGKCEFPGCESGHQLEVDHIHPRALGGSNAPENLRALCRAHNQHEAARIFGSFQRVSTAR